MDLMIKVLASVMNVFLVVGPTGAGKTTLLKALREARFFPGPIARIYNDDGSEAAGDVLVDAGRSLEGESFEPLLAGCFGCRDQASFFAVMDKIRAGTFTWVLIDPLGFVSGDEVTGIVRGWATQRGVTLNLKVLAVVNAAEINEAQMLGVLDSQLTAANVGIAINRAPTQDLEAEKMEGVMRVIDASGASAPVFLLPESFDLPRNVREAILGSAPRAGRRLVSSHVHGPSCQHDHDHHDHAHHGHAHAQHVRLHFLVRPELDRADVMSWFETYFARVPDHGIFRIKGAARDHMIQRGFKDWGMQIEPSSTVPFVTLYIKSSGSAVASDFLDIMVPAVNGRMHGSTRELLRRNDLSTEEDNALVRWLLNHLPQDVVLVQDGPVINPELHELLNEIRKRPGVDPALNAEAMRRRVAYYLACLDVLKPGTAYWSAPGAAERKRSLAIGIGWFCQCRTRELGGESGVILSSARRSGALLARMFVEGLSGFERHNENLAVALEMADEALETLRFLHAFLEAGAFNEAHAHILRLAETDGRPGLVDRWRALLF